MILLEMMELRDFFDIYRKHASLFFSIVVACFIVLICILWLTPQVYVATLTLTVARSIDKISVTRSTSEEDFDSYYRIEADDAFGKTIIAWLESPTIVRDILMNTDLETGEQSAQSLVKHYDASQRSSHVINVQYRTISPEMAVREAESIVKLLNMSIQQLNKVDKTSSWFHVSHKKPFVERFSYDVRLLTVLTTIISLCMSTMTILIYHYALQRPHENRN